MKKAISGFTVVELIIVITVIAILAAIVVVSYNGADKRAHDVAVKSNLVDIYDAMEYYYLQNNHFPYDPEPAADHADSSSVIKAALATIPIKLNTDSYSTIQNSNALYIASIDGKKWAFLARAKGNNVSQYVSYDTPTPRPYTKLYPHSFPGSGAPSIAEDTKENGVVKGVGVGPEDSVAFYYARVGSDPNSVDDNGWRIWK